jgi:hypothetical protein
VADRPSGTMAKKMKRGRIYSIGDNNYKLIDLAYN